MNKTLTVCVQVEAGTPVLFERDNCTNVWLQDGILRAHFEDGEASWAPDVWMWMELKEPTDTPST